MQPGDSSKHARHRLKYLIFCGLVPRLSSQKSYGNALPGNIEGHKQCHRPQHHKGDQSACWPHRVQLW